MRRREPLNPDLTPLIDILFLLLIFFLATSVFKKDEVAMSLSLPKVQYATKKEGSVKNITIHLTKKRILFP